MSCREDILACLRRMREETGREEFTANDLIERMKAEGATWPELTLRAYVAVHMCMNAPGRFYNDIERVRRGVYRLRRPAEDGIV